MMTLTSGDQRIVKMIAHEVAAQVVDKFGDRMIAHHQQTCPFGRSLYGSKRFLLGVLVGLMVLSTGGATLGSLLARLL